MSDCLAEHLEHQWRPNITRVETDRRSTAE